MNAFLVVNKDGIPMIGTKVCATRGGAKNSMAPWLNAQVYDKVGYNTPMARVHQKAQEGFGIPKPIHPNRIHDLVDELRHTPTYSHKYGDKSITILLAEDYNKLIEEIVDEWHVAEIALTENTYKIKKMDLCEDCGGHKDVRFIKNTAQRLCRNCRRP